MNYPNLFDAKETDKIINRLNSLKPDTQPQWGKMDAGQMVAHLNVAYKYDTGKATKMNFIKRFLMQKVIKNVVCGDKPFKHNSRTAPDFLITDQRELDTERTKLIANINAVQTKGEQHFSGRINPSFGELTTHEWNNLYSKHITHHFEQFGI